MIAAVIPLKNHDHMSSINKASIIVSLVLIYVVTAYEKESQLSNLPRKDAASVSSADDAKMSFYTEITEQQIVWTIRDAGGFPTSTVNGKPAMPFWSTKERAEAVIKQSAQYKDFEPHKITLANFQKSWLVGMERDGINVGLNWTGAKAMGYDSDPKTVAREIDSRVPSRDNDP